MVLNLAIGQGENAQSPLKMLQYFAGLANDGTLPTPRVARDGPTAEPAGRLPLSAAQRETLRAAMVEVVNEAGGTARGSRLADWTLAGKTGTAQNPHGDDHAWFIGYAPAEDAAIAAVAVVEAGGHGSSAAAPIVSQLIAHYLNGEREPVDPQAAGG